MTSITRRFAAVLPALAAALLGCGTTEAPGPLQPTGALGRIRFVNLVTDPGRLLVNVSLEGVPFGVNLAYGASTPLSLAAPSTAPYASVLAGTRTLLVKRTADTLVTSTLTTTISAGEDRTVYATGGEANGAVTAFETTDVNTIAPAGQARIRVVNLSKPAGAVDVFITAPGADLSAATPSIAGLAVRGASTYLTLPAGSYQLRTVPAGTPAASRAGAVSVNLTVLTLGSAAAQTIVLASDISGAAPSRPISLRDQ